MKKVMIFLTILVLVTVSFSGCSKENNESEEHNHDQNGYITPAIQAESIDTSNITTKTYTDKVNKITIVYPDIFEEKISEGDNSSSDEERVDFVFSSADSSCVLMYSVTDNFREITASDLKEQLLQIDEASEVNQIDDNTCVVTKKPSGDDKNGMYAIHRVSQDKLVYIQFTTTSHEADTFNELSKMIKIAVE